MVIGFPHCMQAGPGPQFWATMIMPGPQFRAVLSPVCLQTGLSQLYFGVCLSDSVKMTSTYCGNRSGIKETGGNSLVLCSLWTAAPELWTIAHDHRSNSLSRTSLVLFLFHSSRESEGLHQLSSTSSRVLPPLPQGGLLYLHQEALQLFFFWEKPMSCNLKVNEKLFPCILNSYCHWETRQYQLFPVLLNWE